MDDLDHASGMESRQARDRSLFDAIATRYCRKDLLPASRRARRLRLQQTMNCVPLTPATDLLEIGCGAGFAAGYLYGNYASYVGIDQSDQLIDLARRYNASDIADFHVSDVTGYEPHKRFGGIFMIGVLHHLTSPGDVLKHVIEWLEPDGWVVVNEPHPANPLFSYLRRLRKRIHKDYSTDQVEIAGEQLADMFTDAGFGDVFLRPQGLFSTPFAEVIIKPQFLARMLAAPACAVDRVLEKIARPVLRHLSWNLIAAGRRPLNQKRR